MTTRPRASLEDVSGREHSVESVAEVMPGPASERRRAVESFTKVFADFSAWECAPIKMQLLTDQRARQLLTYAIATGAARPSAAYLLASRCGLSAVASRLESELHARLRSVALELGYSATSFTTQWNAVARCAGLAGVRIGELSSTDLVEGRAALIHEAASYGTVREIGLAAACFGASNVLFHAGLIDTLPGRWLTRGSRAEIGWAELNKSAPQLVTTMQRYIGQISLSLRPDSIRWADTSLRLFAGFLIRTDPAVACVADIKRAHIESFKAYLATRPGKKAPTLTRPTIRGRLGALRVFFDRIIEWGYDDAPARTPIFFGDLPLKDSPLPRFLDDPSAAKLLRAARNDPDPFVRLVIEVLARTGLRKSELVRLSIDAVVQIGSAYWLRVPLGKLHDDRYIPLHPQLKELLDDWLAARPEGLRSSLMFTDHGRPITHIRIDSALSRVAERAGIGHVTPHQLRHTLATQAINRGMSLEAIAALLGHRSLAMTMVYARIADRTVAEEYFAVTEKVEALYATPKALPADAEGTEMAKLRSEMHRRMLGNGYCARPVGLDCHFESICESCSFFVTTVEFRPTLRAQRDDAKQKGQVGRQKVFDGLLSRLDKDAS
jgi:integrase